ncbi:YtxH domain-containing protein [Flavobacterium sp. K5-23]|uniref:YtxH domain-containing protein n=1 Tax=Flavobacterium sp. K5-23 TaxID=2746225 RepID=UPI00200BE4DA|nr:YtxH domain-containing protein [Flavobacterium sp. K5-23]UQD56674.1 YtxH domain-containing protein [Flavobacterium sp. K5-23]
MSSSKIVLGVLSGLAVGAIAGILFAPNKGLKTRKKIMSKSNDLVDEMKEKFESMIKRQENIWQDEKDLIKEGVTKLSSLNK